MTEHRSEIIRKYRHVAHLPDGLFAFTFPLRRQAIQRLALKPGERVLDMGCGSGASFPQLVEGVGAAGEVIGVDISPDMIRAARERVEKAGWKNVQVIEAAAEEAVLPGQFDGLHLFAMHDVFTSPTGLDNILAYLKPGGRVVAVGPKLSNKVAGKLLNPLIGVVFSRFAVASQDKDRPWRLLSERLAGLQVEEHNQGVLFLAWGTKN